MYFIYNTRIIHNGMPINSKLYYYYWCTQCLAHTDKKTIRYRITSTRWNRRIRVIPHPTFMCGKQTYNNNNNHFIVIIYIYRSVCVYLNIAAQCHIQTENLKCPKEMNTKTPCTKYTIHECRCLFYAQINTRRIVKNV